jgi:hypothetical protein
MLGWAGASLTDTCVAWGFEVNVGGGSQGDRRFKARRQNGLQRKGDL